MIRIDSLIFKRIYFVLTLFFLFLISKNSVEFDIFNSLKILSIFFIGYLICISDIKKESVNVEILGIFILISLIDTTVIGFIENGIKISMSIGIYYIIEVIVESFAKLINNKNDRFILDIIGRADIYTVAAMSVFFELFFFSFIILLFALILKILISFLNRALLPHIFISFIVSLIIVNTIRF